MTKRRVTGYTEMATRRYKILNELKRASLERNPVLNGFCTVSLNAISPNAGSHAARWRSCHGGFVIRRI